MLTLLVEKAILIIRCYVFMIEWRLALRFRMLTDTACAIYNDVHLFIRWAGCGVAVCHHGRIVVAAACFDG